MQVEQHWYTIKDIHPALPSHVALQQRFFNGELWHVLHDTLNNKFHRINEAAFALVGLMDGRRTLEEIYNTASESKTAGGALNHRSAIELLQYLHTADLLVCERLPSSAEVAKRQSFKTRQKRNQLIKSPYIWRLRLFNPDAVLNKMLPATRFFTSPFFAFLWLVTVAYALILCATHWQQLTQQSVKELFSPQNLLLIWLTYPLLKILHELGHALFTKAWGGKVFECGLVFVLGTPLPYVDATAATGFASKKRRLLVSAAGMVIELFIASIALMIWLNTDDGLLKNILFNIMLIGGVSTLLFNGNPLMRFDGYYLLCDALDSPNLASRAQRQLFTQLKNIFLGAEASSPAGSKREAFWLGLYGAAAFLYRFFILFTIVLIAAALWPLLGFALAGWLIAVQLILPAIRFIKYFFSLHQTPRKRLASSAKIAGTLLLVAVVLFVIPIPHNSRTQGVVWLPDDARIRAQSSGMVVKSLVADGDQVQAGQPLLQLQNLELFAEMTEKKTLLQEYETRYQSAWLENQARAQLIGEDIAAIESEIRHLQKQIDALTVKSPASGKFKSLKRHALEGSFINQGDTAGIVITGSETKVRVALTQDQIANVRTKTREVTIRPVSLGSRAFPARISQEVPNATHKLPSAALSTAAGGPIVVQRGEGNQTSASEQVFLMDITPTEPLEISRFGERVHVRFGFQATPLAFQVGRATLRLYRDIVNQRLKSNSAS